MTTNDVDTRLRTAIMKEEGGIVKSSTERNARAFHLSALETLALIDSSDEISEVCQFIARM